MNHKRKRPKSKRAGCLFCKGYKAEQAPKGARFKANQRRKMQLSVHELGTHRVRHSNYPGGGDY